MNSPHPLLNGQLSWHSRKGWLEALSLLQDLFNRHEGDLSDISEMASELKARIDSVDAFIQENTAIVCPECRKVCCINKHGYYDYQDLVYITALGLKPPEYKEGIEDTAPCQFLSRYGCGIERSIRPFRCNWHFCGELIAFMDGGPARSMREFNLQFQQLQSLRYKMLDRFFDYFSAA